MSDNSNIMVETKTKNKRGRPKKSKNIKTKKSNVEIILQMPITMSDINN